MTCSKRPSKATGPQGKAQAQASDSAATAWTVWVRRLSRLPPHSRLGSGAGRLRPWG